MIINVQGDQTFSVHLMITVKHKYCKVLLCSIYVVL
jgi:hypothetical protein